MNYELFLAPAQPPRSSETIRESLAALPHMKVLTRWASYYNPATAVRCQVDWSYAHLCWSLPTGHAEFFGVELARLIGDFCAQDGWKSIEGNEPQWSEGGGQRAPKGGCVREHILTRWKSRNMATLVAMGPALETRATAPRSRMLEEWSARYFTDGPTAEAMNTDATSWSQQLDTELVAMCLEANFAVPESLWTTL